ncbi:NADH-quinone oxidoreductase subunit NuoN [Mangrovicoccus algicola]|uniref:NADH-quinone oxidoreductase subunit N n=1 Tax=Mangrovicoccus algicola TaxID=2771008 RepID=A0A8J7CHU8_9RHOB|nr:NADH-quinone oxidoreductase subunit NuoN [Mangrovicoccus algicola]MBE3638715.1 NADH-quinone oxidoreductase subunit NuoN [Mangrovicoccus algicola]
MTATDFSTVLPEFVLALFAILGLVIVAYAGKDRLAPLLTWVTAAVFTLTAFWIGLNGGGTTAGFGGLIVDDAFGRFAKVTVLLSAAAVLIMSEAYMERRGILRFEFPVLIVLAVIGMMIMVSADDLMSLYMGLELQSLSLYIVAALRRDSVKSTEAGLKYFVLGALSSGMLLYGASLSYGFAGTTSFDGIASAVTGEGTPLGLVFGLAFLCAGLAFKVSAAPFHMWTPDVYEGSPTPVTTFFATAPKVAAMALFARLLYGAFPDAVEDWQQVLGILSVASMFLGSIAAVGQPNIKRLMAYSSIAHMGYGLMGLASGTVFGVQAMLIYMAIYVTMNLGTFAFVMSTERDGHPVTDIASLSMLSARDPLRALAMALLLFSLAGVPPMLGFFGKVGVLYAAVEGGLVWLAIAGVIASVVAAYYYIRIVYLMYFGPEIEPLDFDRAPVARTFVLASALVMLLGIFNFFGVDSIAAGAAAALVP